MLVADDKHVEMLALVKLMDSRHVRTSSTFFLVAQLMFAAMLCYVMLHAVQSRRGEQKAARKIFNSLLVSPSTSSGVCSNATSRELFASSCVDLAAQQRHLVSMCLARSESNDARRYQKILGFFSGPRARRRGEEEDSTR